VLVGREGETSRIERLIADARAGRSAALVIRGEPGIGKTTLLEHARTAAGEDITILSARGIEAESELPYLGLGDLIGPVLDRRERLPDAQSLALGQALALEEGGTPARFAVPAALLGLLGAVAEEGPLLCLVDDAQWLDAPSLEAMVFAGRRLRDEGVAMILTVREGAGLDVDVRGLEEIRPEPLAPRDAGELVRLAHGSRVRAAVVGELVEAAAGNPLALVELPAALSDEQLAGREALPPVLPAGESVEAAFRRRLAELPNATREALLVLAAATEESLAELVAALARLGLEERALDTAEAAGVIVEEGGRLSFRHPLLRSAAYHLAPPPTRRAAHRALAEGAPEGSPRRAWHLAAGVLTADEDVARDLEEAANDARRRGGHASAARAFARAAELTPEVADRARRLMEAAVESQVAGEFDRAEALATEGLELDADPMMRALLHRVRASVRIRGSEPETGLNEMFEAADVVAPVVPQAAAVMLLEAGLGRMTAGPLVDAVRIGERARDLAAGDDTLEALADVVVAQALFVTGEAAPADALLAARADQLAEMEPPPGASDLVVLAAHSSMWLEQHERSARILASIIDRSREAGALAQLAYPLAVRAQLALREGRWSQARADAEEAVRAGEDTSQDVMLALALGVRTLVEGMLGNVEEARESGRQGLRILETTEVRVFGTFTQSGLGMIALSLGEYDRAITAFEAARDNAMRLGLLMPGQELHNPDLVEAYLRTGDREGAELELERLEELMGPWQPAITLAHMARVRAMLASDEEAPAIFEQALAHHDAARNPFERARTELAYGERLRRTVGREESKPHLRSALETFERLGARLWADRARDELRGTGVTARRETVPIAEVLTPHEMQVAMVVAGGATNKEAAAQLFLSPKTVEHHLGAIYRKLQLRSRTELTALLSNAA
jgi:DNA-binding CsgD family transcriptional regulator